MNRFWDGDHANRVGVSGEILRGCYAYELKKKNELDAQVRRPAQIPCTTCRRLTSLGDLRGEPGRWTCAECAAPPAPEEAPEPEPETQPQPEESAVNMNAITDDIRDQILDLRRQGLSHARIARAAGLTQYTVRTVLIQAEADGVELPPAPRPPGRAPDLEVYAQIVDLLRQGHTQIQVAEQLGVSRSTVARAWAASAPEGEEHVGLVQVERLRAEVERLRATLAETEEGAAELLEEVQRLRAEGGDPRALLAAEDLRRAAEAQAVDARAALVAVQREVEELRGQLAAAEEAARRPPEVRRAEVERLEADLAEARRDLLHAQGEIADQCRTSGERRDALRAEQEARAFAERHLTDTCRDLDRANEVIEDLRAQLVTTQRQVAALESQLDANPWRRAWELRRRLAQATQEERTAELLLATAREQRIEVADELEAAEAALEVAT